MALVRPPRPPRGEWGRSCPPVREVWKWWTESDFSRREAPGSHGPRTLYTRYYHKPRQSPVLALSGWLRPLDSDYINSVLNDTIRYNQTERQKSDCELLEVNQRRLQWGCEVMWPCYYYDRVVRPECDDCHNVNISTMWRDWCFQRSLWRRTVLITQVGVFVF